MLRNLRNAIEELRPDCRFVYNTVDMDFVSSRTENACITDQELRRQEPRMGL